MSDHYDNNRYDCGDTYASSFPAEEPEPDIQVRNEGTVMVFTPLSEAGKAFLGALETEDWQWMGPSLVVDHRPAYDLLEAMKSEGLEVVL
jgi:hypothetical protein